MIADCGWHLADGSSQLALGSLAGSVVAVCSVRTREHYNRQGGKEEWTRDWVKKAEKRI